MNTPPEYVPPTQRESLLDELIARQSQNEWDFAACLLYGADIALRDCTWLQPDHFINKQLGELWKNVLAGEDVVKSANDLGITSELIFRGNNLVSVLTPNVYAEGVDNSKYFVGVAKYATDMIKAAVNKDLTAVRVAAEALLESNPANGIVYHSTEELDELFTKMLESQQAPAIKTFLPELDKRIGGLFGGELTTLAGRPGMGKTALAWVVARNVAFSGKTVVFFSLEMDKEQLWARAVCGHAGYHWRDVRAGLVDDAGRRKIAEMSHKMQANLAGKLYVVDNAYTVGEIIQVCAKLKPDFVIIDHLGEINWDNPYDKEVVWYGKALKMIRQQIARRMKIPVWMLHQLNREVERQNDKRPLLKDLKWSGDVEQISDVVIFVYRDDYYLTNVIATTVPMEVIPRKNRQGPANETAILQYDLSTQDFH